MMSDPPGERKVYRQDYLKRIGVLLAASSKCPAETASYQSLIKNRSGGSQATRATERSAHSLTQEAAQSRDGNGERGGASVMNVNSLDRQRPPTNGIQRRQEPPFDARDGPRNQPQYQTPHTQNREHTNSSHVGDRSSNSPFGQSGQEMSNVGPRGNMNMNSNNMNNMKPRNMDTGGGGGGGRGGVSSAEQQRLQFQKEREEIEAQRLKMKSTEAAGTRTETKVLSFHDETDLLMDSTLR